MRLIDADLLHEKMFHEAFETDTDLQRWDSGCWIRYKLFENVIETIPEVDAVPVILCKDCKWFEKIGCAIKIVDETDMPKENDFCSFGERNEEECVKQ